MVDVDETPGARAAQAGEPGLDRRAALLAALGAAALLALLGGLLVPWDWVPGGSLPTVRAQDVFDAAQIARAESYSGYVRLVGNASYAVSLLVALVLGLTPWGSRIARSVGHRLPGRLHALVVPLLVLALLLAGNALTLPFGLLLHDRRLEEGLTRQGLEAWAGDRALSLLLTWVVSTLLVWLVNGCARRWPRRWFLPAGLGVAAAVIIGSALYPVLVEPLFNRFTPLPDGPLRTSVLRLAQQEGVRVDDVLVADASRRTTTLNAYVSGLGRTRWVVLYDTLLDGARPAEVRAVVAHELAHARHHDVLLGTGLGAVGAFLGLSLLALVTDVSGVRRRGGVHGPGDPAAAALILALVAVGSLLSSPVQNTVSRAIEARADRSALAATGEPGPFRALQVRLALRSLADPTPPELLQVAFGSHPTVLQRIALAELAPRARTGEPR